MTTVDSTAGMAIERRLTEAGVHPFDTVEWGTRDVQFGDPKKPAFKQDDVEFPVSWSQNCANIVAQKYFRGQIGTPARERSVKQMISRVAQTITQWGMARDYFGPGRGKIEVLREQHPDHPASIFYDELTYILLHQMAAFNSPVWFNVGFEDQPQCSACFILSVDDTMDSILDWNTKEGKIFVGGSGSGINLSKIRSSKEPLSKGGLASGPTSYMRGADSWAGTIKSGGKTRRAAKMVVLDVDHPDIRDFIWCKAKEEDKAQALRDAGFDMSIDGEGFTSIQYQNANNSVRVTDEFMQAVENDAQWQTIARVTGEPLGEPMSARELMREIAEAAWRCADPGMQYDTTINDWHTCPNWGRINASNPCSEYMHVDDSACNLSSLNLMKFRREDGTFDIELFEHCVDIMFLAQEITIGTEDQPASSFPTKEIAVNARAGRQIGLGYANLGAYLMANGLPYDSDEGRTLAAAITSLMTGRAYRQSAVISSVLGPYERYAGDRENHNGVMAKHRDASLAIPDSVSDPDLLVGANKAWVEAVELGNQFGYRNAQATVLAPTGTIAFLMDCDTTGIEPDFSLLKVKELVGGGHMTIINRTVPIALQTLGYTGDQIGQAEFDDAGKFVQGSGIVGYVGEKGTIVGAPDLTDVHLPVFDVAVGERAISPMGHIKMMGAVQPFISGAISKTVNMPSDSTVEDIQEAYIEAWRLGVKALAIYRDGSKTAQALRTDAQQGTGTKAVAIDSPEFKRAVEAALIERGPVRRKMPRERESTTVKFEVGEFEGYITAGRYDDGKVGEIFLTDIGKEGSTLRGMMNAFATAISISLQYGVPLETLAEKFSHMKFEPNGRTNNPEIPNALSLPDFIMRWLASRFLDDDEMLEGLDIMTRGVKQLKAERLDAEERGDAPTNGKATSTVQLQGAAICPKCSNLSLVGVGCKACYTCGYEEGVCGDGMS